MSVRMVLKQIGIICLFSLLTCQVFPASGYSQNFDYKKAYQLYLQVLRGEKKIENLTPEERKQVIIIHRIMSSSREKGSEECREAKERARSAADELVYYAERLKRCAESYDFSDDCYTEFRRTKNAFEEYESAVSEVSSECN